MRSVSDSFSLPNDGLDLSNLRASLNVRRRVREELEHAESQNEHRKRVDLEEERAHIRAEERRRIKAEDRHRIRADERQRIEAEERQKFETEKRKLEAEERQKCESDKRRQRDEVDLRLCSQHQYQAPEGCQAPQPQSYAYTLGPG